MSPELSSYIVEDIRPILYVHFIKPTCAYVRYCPADVLGAKLGEHYNPSRLIMELLRGDPLDPIPHNSIRYTYRTHEPSD